MSAVVVSVFVFLFLVVTVLGFAAARWRKADLDSLDEWGLGGRGFGTFISWFLIGGGPLTADTLLPGPPALFPRRGGGVFSAPLTTLGLPPLFLVLPPV